MQKTLSVPGLQLVHSLFFLVVLAKENQVSPNSKEVIYFFFLFLLEGHIANSVHAGKGKVLWSFL